ncbi:MAG: hypothetical protein ABIJ42_06860, partial [Acidobacteriota bacterium]
LLIKFEIGVRKETYPLYSLDDEYFDNEENPEIGLYTSEKSRGIWPLPGGYNSYIETLFKYLETVNKGNKNKSELIEWYIRNFDTVKSEKTVNGYINVPRTMGLTTHEDGRVKLTKAGEEILASGDLNRLYETVSDNVFAFEEIIEFLETTDEIQTEETILEYLKENFGVEWTTSIQVLFRLIWLMNLGKVIKTEDGYTIAN